jgi:hypothetical protein
MTDTWYYASPLDKLLPHELPTEWVWERLRLRRDSLLAQSDFRMVSDAPWDTEPWAVYRQALRDLPNNTTDPRLAEWPVSPT